VEFGLKYATALTVACQFSCDRPYRNTCIICSGVFRISQGEGDLLSLPSYLSLPLLPVYLEVGPLNAANGY